MISTRITINGRDYKSLDEMPPDVRRQYEEAMRKFGSALAAGKANDATSAPQGTKSLGAPGNVVIRTTTTTLNLGSSEVRTIGRAGPASSPESFLFEPSDVRSRARDFFWGLVWWVVIGLVLWFFLGRW